MHFIQYIIIWHNKFQSINYSFKPSGKISSRSGEIAFERFNDAWISKDSQGRTVFELTKVRQ